MKYKINKGFIIQKLEDKSVIFDGEKAILYTFNETASYIFDNLKKGLTDKEILNNLMKRYEIKKEKALKDFKGLISELKKKKIILP